MGAAVIPGGVDAAKYYAGVAPLMIKFTAGRRSAAVRGASKARSAAMTIDDAESLIGLVKDGWIDIMTSVSRDGLIDMVVFDVKGTSALWLSEESSTVFHLAIQSIRESLKFLGAPRALSFFDGMNGFKVLAPLKDGINRRAAGIMVKVIGEAFTRVSKRIKVLGDHMGEITVGGNTMLKVGMFRVPLSLHWSTKLAAVPITGCARNFSTILASPTRVLRDLQRYSEAIEGLGINESALLDVESMDELSLIYELKSRLAATIHVECNS